MIAATTGSPSVRRAERIAWIGAALALAIVIVRTAWLCDDAYITLRTIDNWRAGYGLRWNVAERVQAYTHPLWLLLEAAAWTLTGEHYFSTMGLSIVCAVAGAAILLAGVRPIAAGAAAFVLLLCSGTFVDYSTSGLETPLSYLLLAIFLRLYWSERGPSRPPWLITGAAAFLAVNRLDAAILIAPAILHAGARAWSRRQWRVLFGLAPLACWECFSVVYYGFPFPNTAYAKLATGIPQGELIGQGIAYLKNSWRSDAIALTTIAAATGLSLWRWRPATATIAAGLALHVIYVVRVGGDFMSGRFLAPTLFAAVGLLLFHPTTRPQRAAAALLMSVLILARAPAALARPRFTAPFPPVEALIDADGIADERRIYVRETGLLLAIHRGMAPLPAWEAAGRQLRASGASVVSREAVGFFGFGAGPAVHIVDRFALADPLLARLRAARPWRIGHFSRDLPDGYIDLLRGRRDRLADATLNAYYQDLRVITRDPLWSRRRWTAIVRLNRRGGSANLDVANLQPQRAPIAGAGDHLGRDPAMRQFEP